MRTVQSAGACPLPAPQEHLCRFLRPWSPWPGRGGGAGRQDRDCRPAGSFWRRREPGARWSAPSPAL